MSKTIKEFTCKPLLCSYNGENYKIYAVDINDQKYPDMHKNKYGNYTILGNLHQLALNIEYQVKAEEVKSNNGYGYQYKVIHIKRDRPTDYQATQMFLNEILTYEQTKTIMESYPDIIDRVINNRLEDINLDKLYNIGEYRFNVIKRKIEENFVFAELIEMFKGLLNLDTVRKLYNKYPSTQKVKQAIQEDPYHCLCSLSRISFKTADSIILALDRELKKQKENGNSTSIYFDYNIETSYQRQKAAIIFLLEENESNGNTKMNIKDLKAKSNDLVCKCIHHFVDVIKNDDDIYFDRSNLMVSIKNTYETEKYISDRIIEGLKINNKWQIKDKDYSQLDDIKLTDEQMRTIPMICENNISILTAPGGCGKSQSTKAVINMLKDNNKSFVIFSPTGRASKVISEFTNEPASTIHRGLGYIPPNWTFNEENPLSCDIVIVDESSMIDIFLMKRLIEAVNFNKTKILFIGDASQVPSVGAGNVFYDMINSEIIPVNILTKVFRYGKGGILTVATQTRKSEKFLDNSKKIQKFGEDEGYVFIKTQQTQIKNNLIALYKKLLAKNYNPEDILVLSSYNKGDYGTVNINTKLQPLANPNTSTGTFIKIGETKFYEGDLVIQTVNNYNAKIHNQDSFSFEDFSDYEDEKDKTVFIPNGEIGKIIEIRLNSVIIKFSNDLVVYSRDHMNNIKLAYSISIHKCQGGQCKVIILLTPKAHTFMLNSNLIYVGQTRAKEKVYHLGEPEVVNRAIRKKADFNRKTYLKDFLQIN